MLVLLVNESSERDLLIVSISNSFLDFLWNFETILLAIHVQVILAEHLHNLNQLIEVIATLEERIDFEDHSCHGASERPDV